MEFEEWLENNRVDLEGEYIDMYEHLFIDYCKIKYDEENGRDE